MKSPYSIKSLPLLYTIPIRRAWTLRFCNTLISSITIASTLLLRIMMFSFLFFSCMATFRLLVQKYPSMHACFLPSNFLRNAVSLWCHKLTPILFKDGVAVFLEKTSLPRRWWRIHFWTPSAKDTKHAAASYIYFFLCWSVFFFRLLTCSFFLLAARKWYRLANWRRTRSKHKNRILISAKLFYLYYWRPLFNIQIVQYFACQN